MKYALYPVLPLGGAAISTSAAKAGSYLHLIAALKHCATQKQFFCIAQPKSGLSFVSAWQNQIGRLIRDASDVAQPPILAALLDSLIPSAGKIENDDCSEPHQVDEGQTVAVVVGCAEEKRSVKKPCNRLMK
jgi:hypothetical protein